MTKRGRNRTHFDFHKPFFIYVPLFVFTIFMVFSVCWPAEDKQLRRLKIPETSAGKDIIVSWQDKVRSELSKKLYLPDTKPESFAAKQLKKNENNGWVLEEIEIQSTPGRQILVCMGAPADIKDKKFPAVVCIHGHGGNRYSAFEENQTLYHQFGKRLVERGFIVITTDVGQHEVYEKNRTLMGERLWDLIRCVDYLETLPFVDVNRIGCAGLSLGGEMAMWLGAMDTRIKATVVCGFLTYMDQMERNHCMCWKFEGLREVVDFPDIYALIAPRALQCQNGEKEPPDQFPPSLARKAWEEIIPVYEVLGAKDRLELVIHPGGHEVSIEPMLKFLREQL